METPRFSDFERIVFFTGAGISVESGIPTYRGVGGTWSEYNYKEYACQTAFECDPQKVWDFHDKRRVATLACEPNEGHRIIAAVQAEKPNTRIITQNIDGLHQRAGAKNVIELHGSLWKVRCDTCGHFTEDLSAPITSRMCQCGEVLRPAIVWFGDSLGVEFTQAIVALDNCDLLVTIGTSAIVYPAAELPRRVDPDAVTVEVNVAETEMTSLYHHHLQGNASQMLALMTR
jgi:NAD-dependent deacetylase